MGEIEYDAIVIGTGIAGTSTAIHLARKNKKVLLVGKQGLKGEASTAATGILDPLLDFSMGSPVLKLALQSFQKYPAFIQELEKKTKGSVCFRKTGLLYLAMNPSELVKLKRGYAWQRKCGVPVRFLSSREILKKEPTLDRRVVGGLYFPTLGRLKPKQLMRYLKRYAKMCGVRVLNSRAGAQLQTHKGSVTGVRVGKRLFNSSVVVNATGAWAGSNRRLIKKPKVIPARGQLLITASKKISVKHILHTLAGDYLVPWNKHQYLLGSTVEFAGFKPHTSKRELKKIIERIERLIPEVRGLKPVRDWAGLRPFSKTKKPVVGPTTIKGLFLNTGFYKSGILIGYETSRLLAKWIETGKAPALLKSFQPQD